MARDPDSRDSHHADVIIVGAGAAGLAAAIFASRASARLQVTCVDGARLIGAKILVSGGSRCNVTNRTVEPADFWGGPARGIKRVLHAFPASRAATFFNEIGVALHEEEDGKLFPDTNRSRTVLDALLREAESRGVTIRSGWRVQDIHRSSSGFVVTSDGGAVLNSRRVVLATGGRSLPKTGSDGFGYALARRLGHGYVETTPALAPLVLDGDRHGALAGVSHRAALTCGTGSARIRLEGALLWTHFGISGPVALDISRHWHRARVEGRAAPITMNVCPTHASDALDGWLRHQRELRPRANVQTVIGTLVPAAVSAEWCRHVGLAPDTTMSHLTREERIVLVRALTETPLDVRDSRGYSYAEVTAGGVPLDEVDVSSMESRVCRGLHLVGEMLNVDGRLGGFNFQWAWSSGWVAGNAIARAASSLPLSLQPASTQVRGATANGEPSEWLVTHAALLPRSGAALDVACGHGRNAFWLARRGLSVHAVDRDESAVSHVRAVASAAGLTIDARVQDLEVLAPDLGQARYDAIVAVHYLHRPLFPHLLAALRPGGILVYETFTQAQARRGKPTNPAFLLEPGELRALTAGLTILAWREGEFGGRDVASIVCRRD